jgi:hypothetical protein
VIGANVVVTLHWRLSGHASIRKEGRCDRKGSRAPADIRASLSDRAGSGTPAGRASHPAWRAGDGSQGAYRGRGDQAAASPDTLPTPEETRGQFQRMVELLDEPPPASVQVSDLTCPGPAGPIPLRLYAPQGTILRSLLLYFHGGGWMQGGLETHHGACGKLAAWSDCLVLAVDYRLAPEHKFPAGLEDCLAAWRWLVANTATLGADPERLAIGGDCARAAISPPQLARLSSPMARLHRQPSF